MELSRLLFTTDMRGNRRCLGFTTCLPQRAPAREYQQPTEDQPHEERQEPRDNLSFAAPERGLRRQDQRQKRIHQHQTPGDQEKSAPSLQQPLAPEPATRSLPVPPQVIGSRDPSAEQRNSEYED